MLRFSGWMSLPITLALAGPLPPQAGNCDPHLRTRTGDPYGYRPRGDRCEGIYIQEVAAELWVASFTRGPLNLSPKPGTLRLIWNATETEVHLRADALRPRVHYRMDSVRPPGSTEYVWDTFLLNSLKLEQQEIGIVAWSQRRIGNEERQVYVPVGVGESKDPVASGGEVIVVPGAELRELYITLARLKMDGTPADYILKDKPLRYGYYPAERGVSIAVPQWKSPSMYLLEFGAELAGGGVSTERMWFYGS